MRKRRVDDQTRRAFALAQELRVLIGRLSRRLQEQAHAGDFSSSQNSVLFRLEREGPTTVTNLARSEGVRPQSMGATVSGLQAAGLVCGASDAADGRQKIVSLTAVCQEMIRASRTAREVWLFRGIQAKLVGEEQEELAAALDLLRRLADS